METQKIVNLLNSPENEYSKLQQKKMVRYWHWIKRKLLASWSDKFFNKANRIKSLCDYSDANILVTGDITVTRTIAVAGDNLLQRKQLLAAATQKTF